jgi:hypothetical protein
MACVDGSGCPGFAIARLIAATICELRIAVSTSMPLEQFAPVLVDRLRIAEAGLTHELFGNIRIFLQLGDNVAIAFILQLLLLEFLFGGNALGLFPLQKRRHRDQQAKHQQNHDFGHGQTENQALPVRRALLQYLPVHGQTRTR